MVTAPEFTPLNFCASNNRIDPCKGGGIIYKITLLLYNNQVQKELPPVSKLSPPLKNLRLILPALLATWLVGACNVISLSRFEAQPAGSNLVFVTVTPTPLPLPVEPAATPAAAVAATTPAAPIPANELGKIMILEYHRLGPSEQRYQRTPANFRADLESLYQGGYYPVNFIEVIRGLPNVPAGKKPVALTFDDSDESQFRVLADNTIDPESAVGILLDFHEQYPLEWPKRATFFVLGNDSDNYRLIFGQPEWAEAKIRFLVEAGMEIGSHTANHVDLSVASAERIYWELAISQHVIEQIVPGYQVESLAVPYGGFPYSLDLLAEGQWGDYRYQYAANAAAWGGPSLSPFAETFETHKVSRLEVTSDSLDHWLSYFEQNPLEYYVADGDPSRLTVPQVALASEN
jgi:peptidoglycan/xylan/chitin deacetylase (PgdA/CDA1 family)